MNRKIGKFVFLPLLLLTLVIISNNSFAIIEGNVHTFEVETIDGEMKNLSEYKGNVLLIVNVASKCGFTKHYAGLQELYSKYESQGLVVLGFPCNQFGKQEPGTNEEIMEFCTNKFGVTFPMFDKIEVNGENAHPLFKYLTSTSGKTEDVRWNFEKFLIDKDGNLIKRYGTKTEPKDIAADIEELLGMNDRTTD